ncbi:MAG TPA: response regulator transcription factor [Ottowia sp.]|nr:response regulator transcription factor [Ottowia sp.]
MLDDFALLLVDDHPLFRDGLVAALRHREPGLRVQAVGNCTETLALLAADRGFDLVLLDYHLPDMDGLRWAGRLMRRHPDVAVALMSGLDDASLSARAQQAGLCGFFPKSLEISTLLEQLDRIAQGLPVFNPPAPVAPPAGAHGLTPRQMHVLQAMSRGGSNNDIARALGLAPATVKKHLEAIFTRMGATSRLQAVVMARAWLDEGEPPA